MVTLAVLIVTFSPTLAASHFPAFHASLLRVMVKPKDFPAENTIGLAVSQAGMSQAFQTVHQRPTYLKD